MDDRAPASLRFGTALYEVDGPESRARATAERICFDQAIEAEEDLLPPSLQSAILGHLDELRPISGGRYELPFTMTNNLLSSWRGPRFGIDGLRTAVGGFGRPLLYWVLKLLGRTPRELARSAHQFVEGGVDLIKDDQGLVDQRWALLEERVPRSDPERTGWGCAGDTGVSSCAGEIVQLTPAS